LFGTALTLRFNRGGKGFGVFLALASLIGYYLLALFGEQMARTEQLNAFAGRRFARRRQRRINYLAFFFDACIFKHLGL
jgi:hypothetical protein